MNLFLLDTDLAKAAEYNNNRHVVKIPTEGNQLLCNALHICGGFPPYKPTHLQHPLSVRAAKSRENFEFVYQFVLALCNEYTFRYGKLHKAEQVANYVIKGKSLIKSGSLTPFVQCMPIKYQKPNAIDAYRAYYIAEKRDIAEWKNRPIPFWYK